MVNFQKWIIIGAGLVFLGLFTQEAAATGLTGTLQRTGLGGAAIGSGVAQAGTGIGAGITGLFKGVLSPFWEIRNIVRGFMNLGSATPWLQDTGGGGGTDTTTGDGGGGGAESQPIIYGAPDVWSGQGFHYYNDPNIAPHPVTNVTVHGQDVPLSADAISYYESIGVEVNVNSDGGGTNPSTGGGGGSGQITTPSGGVAAGNLSLGGYA